MLHYIQRSSLEKIYGENAKYGPQFNRTRALKGEEIHYQIVLWSDSDQPEKVQFKDCTLLFTKAYLVKPVLVSFPHYSKDEDPNYLCDGEAMIPDCLVPLSKMDSFTVGQVPTIIWITIHSVQPGTYDVAFEFNTDQQSLKTSFSLKILNHLIEKRRKPIFATISAHSIAEFCNVPLFSNEFWSQLEAHFKLAYKHGVTNIISPLFATQENISLDREPDQLISVSVENKSYIFNFDRLDSWLILGMRAGLKEFTFTTLFPSMVHQRCPRIYAQQYKRRYTIFTEEDDIMSDEYIKFLRVLLRELIAHLDTLKLKGKVTFRFTDEVTLETQEVYLTCLDKIRRALSAQNITDYVRDFGFYSSGRFPRAVVPLCDIEPFLVSIDMPNVTFDIYSTKNLANQLIAAPSVRTRAFGLFYYRYEINGIVFTHFNQYISPITNKYFNPLLTTDGNSSIPSGSTYLVYPDSYGPMPSIRLKMFQSAIQDAAVLGVLEDFVPRDRIQRMIDKEHIIGINDYPSNEEKLMRFRDKIFDLLEKYEPEED